MSTPNPCFREKKRHRTLAQKPGKRIKPEHALVATPSPAKEPKLHSLSSKAQTGADSPLTPLLPSWHLTTSVELIIYFNANEKRMKPGAFQTTGKTELMNLGVSKRLIKDEADNAHNHR